MILEGKIFPLFCGRMVWTQDSFELRELYTRVERDARLGLLTPHRNRTQSFNALFTAQHTNLSLLYNYLANYAEGYKGIWE